jgi:NAD(P)-dependent dehydrogenase (short-subunit alcohol dehydrogenase family)
MTMTREQRVLVTLAAGAAAGLLAARRALRNQREISFEGRVVVITGGSRGLGLVLARQFAAEGARVCLLARDTEELERARRQLPPEAEVLTVRCDIRRRADVRHAMDRVLERWGAVDVLINNAGVIQVGPLEHMVVNDFENAMATHFWGPLHLMYEAVPSMRRRGFGRIVNISSIGGKMAVPHLAPYCASKFALTGLSDSVRSELDQYGIRVTTVAPGLMRTGSPINADFKGQHELEFTWFALSGSMPGVTISAERAARKIIDACRYGDPELTITWPAKLAVRLNHLAPATMGRLLALTNLALPGPTEGAEGNRQQRGRDSQTRWTDSVATILQHRAAVANNEL